MSHLSSSVLKKWLYVLAIASLFTPLLFSPSLYFPFITLPHTFFRLIVNGMLILWLIFLFREKKSADFLRHPLVKAVFIFLAVCYLASFFGLNFSNSFFSSSERLEGLLCLTYFVLYFLILFSTFSKEELEKLIKIELFIALFHCLLALFLLYGPSVSGGLWKNGRLMGITGNPAYFAVYLLFNAFFALYFYFKKYFQNKKFFNFWLIVFVFLIGLIILNATRAVFVGLLGALLLMTFFLLLRKDKESQIFKKIALVLTIVILTVFGLLFAFRHQPFVQERLFLQRLTTFNFQDPATASRLLSYRIGLKIFAQSPILGWGLDSYHYLYPKNFDPQMSKILPDFMFDRVHNKYLEILTDAGLLGLLAYFFIIYWIIKILRKKSQESFLLALPFWGLFTAYFIQLFFIFDFLESYLLLFLTLAFLAKWSEDDFLRKKERKLDNADEKNSVNSQKSLVNQKNYSSELLKIFIFIIALAFVLISSVRWLIGPLYQYYYVIDSRKQFVLKNDDLALKEIRKIFYYQTPYTEDVFVGLKKVSDDVKMKLSPETRAEFLTILAEKGEEIYHQKKYTYSFLTAYADILIDLSEINPSKKDLLKQILEDLLTYDIPYSYSVAAKYYLVLEHDLSKAKEMLEKSISLTDYLTENYYMLFLLENELGNIEQANYYLKKTIQANRLPTDKNLIFYSANLFVPDQDYQTIVKIYSRGIELYPEEAEFYVKLATAYGKLKNKEKAIYYANKAVEIMPSLKEEADKFLELIINERWDEIPD